MRKPAEVNTRIEAVRDGETSINIPYRTQLGALVFTTGTDALARERLGGVLLATVE
jgi:hypothetical protein